MKRATVQLGDFLTLKRGYDLPEHARLPGEIPVVSSSGITGTHKEPKVDGPGVVTGRYGTLGEVFYIEEPFWPLNTALYVQDFKGNHRRFVSYFLKWVLNGTESNKAAVPGVNRNDLHARKVGVPQDIGEQASIASVLSAYDDLIENNRRRIQLLEQAARLLYKEWFVHLRFPGHEHTQIIDGVPEGWEKKKIAEFCETIGGGTPSTKVSEYWDGDITWVVPSDITNNNSLILLKSERKITEKGLRESSAKLVPAESILMTSRASVGFFALMDHEVCTNQGFINIVPHDNQSRMYLLFNLLSRVNEIRSNAKGTTYPEISKGRFREMDITIPSKILMEQFGEIAYDVIRQVRCLMRSNMNLTKARDLLLPKLMNGEVAV
jgi:type I restriction enzyme S subunit